jgi:hypothetical protein
LVTSLQGAFACPDVLSGSRQSNLLSNVEIASPSRATTRVAPTRTAARYDTLF